MEKTAEDIGDPPTFGDYDEVDGKSAGHLEFSKRVSRIFLVWRDIWLIRV
jgi:hypothetical protein